MQLGMGVEWSVDLNYCVHLEQDLNYKFVFLANDLSFSPYLGINFQN